MSAGAGVPLAAFLAADYVVIDAGREVVVRIGQTSGEVDALLIRHGAGHGVFITGWNPRSRVQSPEANAAANDRLALALARRGAATLPHVGRARESDWAEEGFFALDLDPAEAQAIAAAFGQFGVVVAASGAPADLLLTALADPADAPP